MDCNNILNFVMVMSNAKKPELFLQVGLFRLAAPRWAIGNLLGGIELTCSPDKLLKHFALVIWVHTYKNKDPHHTKLSTKQFAHQGLSFAGLLNLKILSLTGLVS